jgi:hypothetical protein
LAVVRKVFLGLPLLAGLLIVSGCGKDNGPFNFPLKNNLHETVVLQNCLNAKCTRVNNPTTFVPGQVAQDVGVPDQILRSVKVFTQSGKALGCLPIQFSTQPPSSFQINLSEMVPCGNSGGSHGKDWPSS